MSKTVRQVDGLTIFTLGSGPDSLSLSVRGEVYKQTVDTIFNVIELHRGLGYVLSR